MITPGQEQHLGDKAFYILVSQKMFAGIVVMVVALLLSIAGQFIASQAYRPLIITSLVVFVIGLVVLAAGYAIARIDYSRRTFTFEEFDLRLKNGILTVTEVSIPYRQMQDINIERRIFHQLTGTSRVIIDSAGHEETVERNETNIVLDPIDMDLAEDIRLMLQRKIGVQVVETEKEADAQAGTAKNP